MGKVITVMNMKGGVGKTTVTASLGGFLAHYKVGGKTRNVLLIDYDPQFNLSQSYIPASQFEAHEKGGRTVLSVLLDDPTKLDPFRLRVSGNEKPPKLSEIEVLLRKPSANSGRMAIVLSTPFQSTLSGQVLDPDAEGIQRIFRAHGGPRLCVVQPKALQQGGPTQSPCSIGRNR
jgi:hypothetical protein